MHSRWLLIGTFLLLGGVAFLFSVDLWEALQPAPNERYVAFNDVQGSAIEHAGKLYTLNFEQQNALIDLLNHAIPASAQTINQRPQFENIVIYRFNDSDIILTPVGYADGALLFAAPTLADDQLLVDSSHGGMQQLLTHTYDP